MVREILKNRAPDAAPRQADGGDRTGQSPASPSRAEQVLKLFLAHHGRLVSFLRAKVGSQQEAEDLAQKAYEELLAVRREETASFFASYLYRTATNLAINRSKEQGRARQYRAAVDHGQPPTDRSPEPLWLARERLELLGQALDRLPPRIRMVFILRFWEDLQYDEIVARMALEEVKIDRRTAMRYVERALVHCQKFMAAADAKGRVRR
jgi:RNA polymerase sigma factor (sigma-70 family)